MSTNDIYSDLFFAALDERDQRDESNEELSDFLAMTSEPTRAAGVGLIAKLNSYPCGSFSVTEHSLYKDDTWDLGRMKNSFFMRISFDRELEGANDFKRAFTFYLLPEFNPFGRIRSHATTKTCSHEYNVFEKYVFGDNSLSPTKEGIALLTPQLLNDALDRARDCGLTRHYNSVYFFLRLWISLSAQNYMPVEFVLTLNFSKVDNVERQNDFRAHFKGTMQTWVPFSESDLEKLIDYSLFWIDKAMPALKNARDFLASIKGLDQMEKGRFSGPNRWIDAEAALNITIDEIPVLQVAKQPKTDKENKICNYGWVWSYASALDKIRNGIFVLIALLTGLRVRELCALNFDDIYADGNGDYWINVVRFKTSTDPNYQGETDTLPLPKFVGDKIRDFEHLKNIYKFQKEGYIFQSNKSDRALNFPTSATIVRICSELMDATGVDRIHAHRFRKTIAEILIHRDERNIHIIRLLFGHKSYAMTLRYISRNPYLVASVASALEHNFAHEFHEIVTSISQGSYSGPAADRIAKQLQKRPDSFIGQRLQYSLLRYIAHLLEAGHPIFIQRVSLGTYCLTDKEYSQDSLPPCLLNRKKFIPGEPIFPDRSNCQPECVHSIVLGKAKKSIESNIDFYSKLLENQSEDFTEAVKTMLRRKIAANEDHLQNLNRNPAQFGKNIIARSSI